MKYTMKQRISYNEGLAKSGGKKAERAKGYLQGVRDQQTASRIARARAVKKAENEKGGKK